MLMVRPPFMIQSQPASRFSAKGTYQDRTLILITDGMDNVSKTSRSDALDSVARDHVQVYAIGIGNASAPTRVTIGAFMAGDSDAVDKELLDTIAIQSGGRDFIVKPMGTDNGREFADAIAAVSRKSARIRGWIMASPRPDATATVTVVNKPDDTVISWPSEPHLAHPVSARRSCALACYLRSSRSRGWVQCRRAVVTAKARLLFGVIMVGLIFLLGEAQQEGWIHGDRSPVEHEIRTITIKTR